MEDYDQLRIRVEKYFEMGLHSFEQSKHNKNVCVRCFLDALHPLHPEEPCQVEALGQDDAPSD